jgi:hypothetical protein
MVVQQVISRSQFAYRNSSQRIDELCIRPFSVRLARNENSSPLKAKERRAAADFLSDNLRALEDGRGRERVSSGKEWVQGSSEANSSRDSRREHGAFFAVSQQRDEDEIYITRIETFSSYLITIPPRERSNHHHHHQINRHVRVVGLLARSRCSVGRISPGSFGRTLLEHLLHAS